MKYLLTIWYCTLANPICQPASDPTGPPAQYSTATYLNCELGMAESVMFGRLPDGLVIRHTCTPDGENL